MPTSLGLVTNYVDAVSTLRSVAARVGLKPSRLRNHIETKALTGITGAKVGTPAAHGDQRHGIITRKDREGGKRARPDGDHEGRALPGHEDPDLKQQLAYDTAQLEAVNGRLASARATQAQVLSDKSISATDKLVSLANLNSVITQALAQQVGLSQDRFNITQQLSRQEHRARPDCSAASATKAAGPNSRTGAAVGGLIGLIVGILAALLWTRSPPVARPRNARGQARRGGRAGP